MGAAKAKTESKHPPKDKKPLRGGNLKKQVIKTHQQDVSVAGPKGPKAKKLKDDQKPKPAVAHVAAVAGTKGPKAKKLKDDQKPKPAVAHVAAVAGPKGPKGPK